MQETENVPQRRSRIANSLNVPQRVRLGSSLAVVLLDDLFESPAGALVSTVKPSLTEVSHLIRRAPSLDNRCT